MVTIYHNPRCSKSRLALAAVEASDKECKVVRYLENPLTHDELKEIINLLNIEPIELVRKNEKIWKENYKEKKLLDAEIIDVMVTNPKLIERPIVILEKKAVIGRPTERVEALLDN